MEGHVNRITVLAVCSRAVRYVNTGVVRSAEWEEVSQ